MNEGLQSDWHFALSFAYVKQLNIPIDVAGACGLVVAYELFKLKACLCYH